MQTLGSKTVKELDSEEGNWEVGQSEGWVRVWRGVKEEKD